MDEDEIIVASPSNTPPRDPKLEEDIEEVVSSVRKSTRSRAPAKNYHETKPVPVQLPPPKRKIQPIRGNWSVDHLLTNPKSKLASISLPELLSSDRAWTELSKDQQLELIALLPGASIPELPVDDSIPNVPRQFLKTNNSFLSDIRLFQEDLAAGRYDPVWLHDAQNAMDKRANGDFDDWKDKSREEFWGQKQKVDWNALAGESSQHSLATLVKAGYIEIGDIWLLRAVHVKKEHGQSKEQIVVEKEATVSAISQNHTLSFEFPPGQHKFSSPSNGQDISIDSVDTPQSLLNAIVNEDGRLAGIRRANSWRDFRCIRKNQDMGTVWDLRELYQLRQARG